MDPPFLLLFLSALSPVAPSACLVYFAAADARELTTAALAEMVM